MSERLQAMRDGGAAYGMLQVFPEAGFAEIAAWAGYDFVIVDNEHGVIDEPRQLDMLRAIAAGGAFSIVRLAPGADAASIVRYLDFGANGVLLSHLETPAQAEAAARAASSGPGGGRNGTDGQNRGTRYGLGGGPAPLLLGLIESMEGVRNVEAILAVEGFDGVILGPHDLSGDLGTGRDYDAPAYVAALETVEAAARAAGKILGSMPHGRFTAPELVRRGHRMLMLTVDIMIVRNGLVQTLAAAKGPA